MAGAGHRRAVRRGQSALTAVLILTHHSRRDHEHRRNAAPSEGKPIITTAQESTPNNEPSGAQKLIGDFAPKLVELTDDVLFGDVWARPELTPRDRSLITCAALITNGSTEQLRAHLGIAKINGVTETELKEVIIHLAFYAGWPRAMSAIMVAKEVFAA